jgi:hypothetical protein
VWLATLIDWHTFDVVGAEILGAIQQVLPVLLPIFAVFLAIRIGIRMYEYVTETGRYDPTDLNNYDHADWMDE